MVMETTKAEDALILPSSSFLHLHLQGTGITLSITN